MKIAIVGGGPAGLFFAKLMKQSDPDHQITIYEQNPEGATYGFGVVLTDIALRFLDEIDPQLKAAIIAAATRQDSITIIHQGEAVPIQGNVFYGIPRLSLLNILQSQIEPLGVDLRFGQRLSGLDTLAGHDLIVGADGVNSTVRTLLKEHFRAMVEPRRNMWAWYGTHHASDSVCLVFQPTAAGLFIGHTYRYAPDGNTFVVECSPETWRRAGLDHLSDEESVRYCSNVFRDFLQGEPLLSNRSLWFNPAFVTAEAWYHGNVVLIGDALKTVHPTIGSGTRVAMQDAIALAEACQTHGQDVPAALAAFVEHRRPDATGFQDAALRSIEWYETVEDRLALDPLAFAYDFMMRTGKVSHDRLRRMDPAFVESYERSRPAVA